MKEATGELNMTVITIIMIGAILAFFWFMWGQIKGKVQDQWDDATDSTDRSYNYNETNRSMTVTNSNTTYTMNW